MVRGLVQATRASQAKVLSQNGRADGHNCRVLMFAFRRDTTPHHWSCVTCKQELTGMYPYVSEQVQQQMHPPACTGRSRSKHSRARCEGKAGVGAGGGDRVAASTPFRSQTRSVKRGVRGRVAHDIMRHGTHIPTGTCCSTAIVLPYYYYDTARVLLLLSCPVSPSLPLSTVHVPRPGVLSCGTLDRDRGAETGRCEWEPAWKRKDPFVLRLR